MSATPNAIRRFGLTFFLAAIAAAAASVLGIETDWGQRSATPTAPMVAAVKAEEINLLPPFTLPPMDPTFKESIERPLFSASRRPVQPAPPPAAAAPTMQKGQFRLVGTSVSAEAAVALLVDTKTGKTLRAKKGDDVRLGDASIKVEQVTPTQVVLRQGLETEELGLRTAASPSAQVAAAAIGTRVGPGPTGIAQQQIPGGTMPSNPAGFSNGFPTPSGGTIGGFPAGMPMPPAQGGTPMPLPPGGQFGGLPMPLPPGGVPPGLLPPGAADQPASGIDPAIQRRRRFQNQQQPSAPK